MTFLKDLGVIKSGTFKSLSKILFVSSAFGNLSSSVTPKVLLNEFGINN